jgi:hypothetical protein
MIIIACPGKVWSSKRMGPDLVLEGVDLVPGGLERCPPGMPPPPAPRTQQRTTLPTPYHTVRLGAAWLIRSRYLAHPCPVE